MSITGLFGHREHVEVAGGGAKQLVDRRRPPENQRYDAKKSFLISVQIRTRSYKRFWRRFLRYAGIDQTDQSRDHF